MTEQELQAIDDLLAKLPGGGEWWADMTAPMGWAWEVRYRDGDEGEYDAVAARLDKPEAHYIAKSPRIIRQLRSEVQFLRGQLADLCEDSRAVAEVGRLRGVIQEIRSHVDSCQLVTHLMTTNDFNKFLARLREMANVEGGNT
mgnify:CR=1 FL=1